MKLRQSPGGTWCGTEKDWKDALKAEGINPKTYTGRVFVEIPTDKAGLMEFLTFHGVNVVNPGGTTVPEKPKVDVAALRAEHNPTEFTPTPAIPDRTLDLDTLFMAAPLGQQLTLAGIACEAAYKRIG